LPLDTLPLVTDEGPDPNALEPVGRDVQRLSLPEQIYTVLRSEISAGALKPGPLRLKPLAARFGTSQIPVREALRRLEAEHLVSFNDSRAIVVNGVWPADVEEIFAIRMELECLALRLAAPQFEREPRRLEDLQRLIERMDLEQDDRAAWLDTNERFHTTMYEAARTPRLLGIIRNQWAAVQPFLRVYVLNVPSLDAAQAEHHQLVALLRSGEIAEAERVLRQQLGTTRDVVLVLLGREIPATTPR
jgi:DNA-binding GntR family transcriptional regulator